MATLSDYLKKQINPEDEKLIGDIPAKTPGGLDVNPPVSPAIQFLRNRFSGNGMVYGPNGWEAAPPPVAPAAPVVKATPNPLALTAGESVVAPNAVRPAPVAAVQSPEQKAVLTPRVTGGVRNRVAGTAPVMQQEAAPAVESNYDAVAAYKARTGIDINAMPSNSLVTNLGAGQPATQDFSSVYNGTAATQLAEQNKILNAFNASPEGQKLAAQDAANAGMVEVVRNGVSSFENFTPGAPNPALRDYMFGQQQKEQMQKDYASAIAKPVGAKLTLGETEALKATDRAMQEQGDLGVAGVHAGAQVRSAEIGAAAGKNPLYEAAVEDIANTPADQRAAKLQQYLGGKSATAVKADPMAKVYAEQLYNPEEQAAFAGLLSLGESAPAAFAAVKQKFGAKK